MKTAVPTSHSGVDLGCYTIKMTSKMWLQVHSCKIILSTINSFLVRFKACSVWGNSCLLLQTKTKTYSWGIIDNNGKATYIFVKWMCCACPLVFWTLVSKSIDHSHNSSWRETLQMMVYSTDATPENKWLMLWHSGPSLASSRKWAPLLPPSRLRKCCKRQG